MLDIIVRAEAGPERGTDVPGTIRFRAGGSAANTARAFAGLGGTATFVGAIGDDALGRRLAAALRASGVTVRVVTRRGATPLLVALVAGDGQRSFVTDRGVADALRSTDVKPAWLERTDALHLPAYSLLVSPLAETAVAAAERARAGGGLVSIDLASSRPLEIAGLDRVTRRIKQVAPDILFANAAESAALVGPRGARRLLRLAPVAVVKEGSAGCRVLWRGDDGRGALEIDIATKPIAAADTTGAGDAFDAGFLHRYLSDRSSETGQRRAAQLRRAAVAGHRAAGRLLTTPRAELAR